MGEQKPKLTYWEKRKIRLRKGWYVFLWLAVSIAYQIAVASYFGVWSGHFSTTNLYGWFAINGNLALFVVGIVLLAIGFRERKEERVTRN